MAEIPRSQAFSLYLQHELLRLQQKNSRFSLRAYAKMLSLEPAFLSKILNGKRKVTANTLNKLAPKLGLNHNHILFFMDKNSKDNPYSFSEVSLEQYSMISDWYHFAILELINLKNFSPKTEWISESLGISEEEVKQATSRLVQLGLLSISNPGRPHEKWKSLQGNNTTIGNPFTAIAFRNLQIQILQQSLKALEIVPIEYRDHSSMTMSINQAMIPKAKEKIKTFRRDLCQFLEGNKNRDSIYQLSISLFPVFMEKP
jgi:uncharacterized protein (TIGR02147 family)